MGKPRPTKAQKRRALKKAAKARAAAEAAAPPAAVTPKAAPAPAPATNGVEVEYVGADVSVVKDVVGDKHFEDFSRIFERFQAPEELLGDKSGEAGAAEGTNGGDAADKAKEEAEAQVLALSKKKRKMLNRLSVSELKQLVSRPEVVEVNDVSSSDPINLVHLKGYRNTVPVPRHWSMKRRYLQGKRGIDKPPFELPDYIANTGIDKLRQAAAEQDDGKKLKQKTRDRMNPKMGRVEIDYQILHNAFFKFQTKPKLTRPGDVYYEGKEFEFKEKEYTPGNLSSRLREALGMTETSPPPYLINMQRYGPPPSYPNLPIPGLSAPIPKGAAFGYQAGGWGKPPVDEMGNPLYGDVFGTAGAAGEDDPTAGMDKSLWGELAVVSDESSSEEESDDDSDDEPGAGAGAGLDGTDTPVMTGVSSVVSGLGTPASITLRKGEVKGLETPETPVDTAPKELYTVLQEQSTRVGDGTLVGSTHTYQLPVDGEAPEAVAAPVLDPDEGPGKRKRRDKAGAAKKRTKEDLRNVF